MRRLVWLLLASVLSATHAGAQQPVIDMHLHAFGFDEYGDPAPPNEITGASPAFRSDAAYDSALWAELQRHRIVRVVASGPWDRVAEWMARAPVEVMGGAYTGARDPLAPLDELRRMASTGVVQVFGELGLQYRGLHPDDPELQPYWELAAELGVPVGVHTGLGDAGTPFGCCPDFRASLGRPLQYEDILVRNPDLRLYLMHGGYPFLDETKALLTIYPQVYIDVAVINWAIPREEFHTYLQSLVQAGFADRIMFGSDQMVWPETVSMGMEAVLSASFLNRDQLRAILYDNAARFLRLTEEEIRADHARAAQVGPPPAS